MNEDPPTSRSRSQCTGAGEEAQEQASQDALLNDLARLCRQQQKELSGLRDLLNEMTGAIKRLEQRLSEQQKSQNEHVNNLEARCQRQEAESGKLRDCVNEMTGTVQYLEYSLNNLELFEIGGLKGWVEDHLQVLAIRLVRCYVIAQ